MGDLQWECDDEYDDLFDDLVRSGAWESHLGIFVQWEYDDEYDDLFDDLVHSGAWVTHMGGDSKSLRFAFDDKVSHDAASVQELMALLMWM